MRKRAAAFALGLSIALAAFATWCYGARPDAWAAVTLWPPWVWAIPGVPLAVAGSWRWRRVLVSVLLVWALYLALCTEELPALLRRPHLTSPAGAIRVVSLNCSAGTREAMLETATFHPDIVLLQESPGRQDVERFCRILFGTGGGYVWGPDASVIARGRVTPARLPAQVGLSLALARIHLPAGGDLGIGSLRLTPPLVRYDLWSPACWRDQASNRRARRAQMESLLPHLTSLPAGLPLVVGGDFNAPAGDAVPRLLRPRLHDTYHEAGAGWGDTVLNELPVLRFDQVWAGRQLHAEQVFAVRSRHSDHRLVVCDLASR